MAWETGTTYVTLPGASGPPSSSKFLIVWRKEADGQWRIAACALTANPKS
jgi:ketosteroid isomerase-like protein